MFLFIISLIFTHSFLWKYVLKYNMERDKLLLSHWNVQECICSCCGITLLYTVNMRCLHSWILKGALAYSKAEYF